MENKVKSMIVELKEENNRRVKSMNTGNLEQSTYSIYVHLYNHNLEIIKKLENVLK